MPTLAEVYLMGDELAAHLAWLRAAGRTQQTIKSRASILGRFAEHMAPRSILDATEDDVILWLDSPGWSRPTRRTYHANLAAFYQWAVRREHVARSPLRDLPKPKIATRPPRPIPDDEFTAAVRGAPSRTRVWLILARYGGLRAAEIANLQPEDVNWHAGTFTIHGKGMKDAIMPMHPVVASELEWWTATHGGETWDATADDVSHAGNHALRSAGSSSTFHACRHAYAMHLYDLYRDVALVSRALRHSSPAVTAVYAQTRDEQLADAVRNMGLDAEKPPPTG